MNLLNKLMKSTLLMLTMLTKNIFIKNLLKDMMMLKIRQRKPIQISFWKTLFKRLLVCSTTFSIEGKINQSYPFISRVYHFSFNKRFGLARSKRDLAEKSEGVCPTRTHFIHPRVAFSVKGQWLYIVNLPGRADQQQGIVTEECTWVCLHFLQILRSWYLITYLYHFRTSKCEGICSSEISAKCEPQFVQKRLVALHPSGHKLISELFWFPATCRCVVK